MTQKIRKEGAKHETVKSPMKTDVTIKCRGCKKVHEYKNEYPTELTCVCGYVIAKDGKIWPSGVNDG